MLSPGRALSVRLSVCVWLSVCLSVCLSVTAFYLDTIRPILMKLGPHDLIKNLRWLFSQILKMLLQWRHGGHFIWAICVLPNPRNASTRRSSAIRVSLKSALLFRLTALHRHADTQTDTHRQKDRRPRCFRIQRFQYIQSMKMTKCKTC